jgi:hypothetical protein
MPLTPIFSFLWLVLQYKIFSALKRRESSLTDCRVSEQASSVFIFPYKKLLLLLCCQRHRNNKATQAYCLMYKNIFLCTYTQKRTTLALKMYFKAFSKYFLIKALGAA